MRRLPRIVTALLTAALTLTSPTTAEAAPATFRPVISVHGLSGGAPTSRPPADCGSTSTTSAPTERQPRCEPW